MIGSGIGGIEGIADTAITMQDKGPRRVSPFFIPGRIINLASGYVSIEFGLKGPNHAVATACSTGAHAIGDSARMIALGDADVMVAGGTESPINRLSMAGFAACRALYTAFNDDPPRASRPYDKRRDGFVMGEGAGVMVLEEYEHAKARGAKIYAEVAGYGATSDGHDMVAPSGEGAARCMNIALADVKAPVDYINPHATSTPIGDIKEIEAIRAVFGDKVPPISATKSLTGHSLGAAGVQEAIYSLLMMNNGFICESANIENLDPAFADVPIVRERRDNVALGCVLSNSFGFGGTNASVVFKRLDA
jgi:3-oxoacyl-[acyl-carrier-protein] synthase-1